jgi:hypothetical protein
MLGCYEFQAALLTSAESVLGLAWVMAVRPADVCIRGSVYATAAALDAAHHLAQEMVPVIPAGMQQPTQKPAFAAGILCSNDRLQQQPLQRSQPGSTNQDVSYPSSTVAESLGINPPDAASRDVLGACWLGSCGVGGTGGGGVASTCSSGNGGDGGSESASGSLLTAVQSMISRFKVRPAIQRL